MAESRLIRVVVADGDPEVQARFVALLAGLPGVGVPVPVATADELSERLRAGKADVVLVAEELGGVSGLELCSSLGLRHPDVKLLFTALAPIAPASRPPAQGSHPLASRLTEGRGAIIAEVVRSVQSGAFEAEHLALPAAAQLHDMLKLS